MFREAIARQRLIVAIEEGDDELAFDTLLLAYKGETRLLTLTGNGKHS